MKLSILALAVAGVLLCSAAVAEPAGTGGMTMPPGAPQWLPYQAPLPVLDYHPPAAAIADPALLRQSAAGATIPLWSASISSLGQTFTYTMVGQNPQKPLANPATTVTAVIVPVKFTFTPQNVVFDPTAPDPDCSPAGTAIELTMASPIFQDVELTTAAGTLIGTGQYPGLFQRGNFFEFTGPGGINPDFAFTLRPSVQSALSITVTSGTVQRAPCGNLGLIDIDTWDKQLRTQIFPQLRSVLTPKVLPIFLFYNVVMYGNPAHVNRSCCILGYHSAFLNRSHRHAFQSYAIADYDTSRAFQNGTGGIADVSILSHEVDEWQDDPNGRNRTPAWGHVGQVGGCQSDLEVGDPLTGTLFAIAMGNGVTYHVQDLAFLSWFYRQQSSIGVDGLYSLLGTFAAPAVACG